MSDHVEFGFHAPAKLINANQRIHHMARHRLVAEWRNAAKIHARAALGAGHPHYDRARIDIYITFTDRRVRDIANYHPTAKAIVDGLVTGRGTHKGLGILDDDDDTHLEGPLLHNPGHIITGPLPWITVTITALDTEPSRPQARTSDPAIRAATQTGHLGAVETVETGGLT